jgi:hypothetical protein
MFHTHLLIKLLGNEKCSWWSRTISHITNTRGVRFLYWEIDTDQTCANQNNSIFQNPRLTALKVWIEHSESNTSLVFYHAFMCLIMFQIGNLTENFTRIRSKLKKKKNPIIFTLFRRSQMKIGDSIECWKNIIWQLTS